MEPLIQGLDRPARVLLTGASSGIGFALAKQLSGNPQVGTLFLVSRQVQRQPALRTLACEATTPPLLLEADLTCEADMSCLAKVLLAEVDGLDLVINTVGFLHDAELKPEKSISAVTLSGLSRAFLVNAFTPALLARTVFPLLRHSGPAVFASLSARVGSIGDNRLGGWYGYRASKAAQNQLLKTFSIELARTNPRAIVLLLHPGTTDTPLSQPYLSGVASERLFSPDRSASQLMHIIRHATPEDNGCFLAWDGSEIPW